MLFKKSPPSIYLDYASATPVSTEVYEAMRPYFTEHFGNPGSIHNRGVYASHAIASARAAVARTLRVRTEHVFFTANGTESNNIALQGVVAHAHAQGRAYSEMEVLASSIEHASVTETLSHLRSLGLTIKEIPVDKDGIIIVDALDDLLTERTILVTAAYVNSEIGVVQPIQRIARTIRSYEEKYETSIRFHVDGAQALLWLPCALDALGADLLSLDAGKCYGPKGVGMLIMRRKIALAPIMFGGSQEGGLRPGTENVPLIVGASEAVVRAQQGWEERHAAVQKLRDHFINELEKIDGVVLNGSRVHRVANNVNISIPGIDAEYAVITLNEYGVHASTKSACGGARGDGSSVVRTMSGDNDRAISTIRFTLGYATTQKELDTVCAILATHVRKTRSAQDSLTA